MRTFLGSAALLSAVVTGWSQGPPPARVGGFIPGQQRPAGDPVQIERGGKLYSVSCRSCHGADLRGGDMGGPNLLRSQLALSDRDGELIVPVIQGSLQASGMPAIKMSPEDAKAVAAYVRSVLATIGTQGKPPSIGQAAAECAGWRCRAGAGILQGEMQQLPFAFRRSARHRARSTPIRRFCRIPG